MILMNNSIIMISIIVIIVIIIISSSSSMIGAVSAGGQLWVTAPSSRIAGSGLVWEGVYHVVVYYISM